MEQENDRTERERRKRKNKGGKGAREDKNKRTEKRAKASESDEDGGATSGTEEAARYQEYIARIKAGYVPLHPQLLDLTKWGLADSFVRLCVSPSDNREHLIAVRAASMSHACTIGDCLSDGLCVSRQGMGYT
jgi:hypothetical protein